jgi:hypothetical protein
MTSVLNKPIALKIEAVRLLDHNFYLFKKQKKTVLLMTTAQQLTKNKKGSAQQQITC